MKSNKDAASIGRRLRFVGKSRSFFDAVAGRLMRLLKINLKHSYQHIPDRSLHYLFDLIESARTGGIVPGFGNVCSLVGELEGPLEQPPVHRGYWYDRSQHTMVGFVLGLDLIQHEGKHVVLEMNTSAGMKPARRALYDSEFDPLVENLVSVARELEFKRLVVWREFWQGLQREFLTKGDRAGIVVIPASYPWMESDTQAPMHRLPEVLEPETMYVWFGSRCAPINFFVNDKHTVHEWLNGLIQADPALSRRLSTPHSSEKLIIPTLPVDSRWPNLVVKVSGKGSGKSMALAKVRSEEEALQCLEMRHPGAFPGVLRAGPVESLYDWTFQRNRVLFQPFLAPRLNNGSGEIIRPHVLISPLSSGILSVHKTVSDHKMPEACPFGLVEDPRPYIVNPTHGAHFEVLPGHQRAELEEVSDHLTGVINTAIQRKFEFLAPTGSQGSSEGVT